jgi:hypothetical protein
MIDEKFMEFWGTFLIGAARGKRQMDEMVQWMQKGFPDIGSPTAKWPGSSGDDILSLFSKIYGLDRVLEYGEEYLNLVKKSSADFQNAYNEYLAVMGMVPRKDHLELVEKYEELKKTCSRQEETIKHLQMLLGTREKVDGSAMNDLQHIVEDQTELFQKMMKDFSRYIGNKREPEQTKKQKAKFERSSSNGTEQSHETDS